MRSPPFGKPGPEKGTGVEIRWCMTLRAFSQQFPATRAHQRAAKVFGYRLLKADLSDGVFQHVE